MGYGQPSIANATVPRGICSDGNRTYVTWCLRLIEFMGQSDEAVKGFINILQDRSNNNEVKIRDAAESIAEAFGVKIKQLDKKDVRKLAFLGMGSRVRDYKMLIAKAMTEADSSSTDNKYTADNVDIIERSVLDALIETKDLSIIRPQGTLEGNKSMMQYIGNTNNKT